MENDIFETIKSKYSEFTNLQRKVADCILSNPTVILLSTVKETAEAFSVSTATIIRFANALGYSGYSELQEAVRSRVRQQFDPVNRLNSGTNQLISKDTVLEHIYKMQMANLERLYNEDLLKNVRSAVELIKAAPHIYSCGARGSYSVAYYFGHHMNRIFRNCSILRNDDTLPDQLVQVQPDDVIFVVNQPRYNPHLYRGARYARSKGAKIIAISDSSFSPYHSADVFFSTPYQSSDYHNSLLPSILIVEMIITATIENNVDFVSQNLSEMEDIFRELDVFL